MAQRRPPSRWHPSGDGSLRVRPRQRRRRSASVGCAAARSSSMPRCSLRSERRSSVNRARGEPPNCQRGRFSAASSQSKPGRPNARVLSPGEARAHSAAVRSRSRSSAFSSSRSSLTSEESRMRSSKEACRGSPLEDGMVARSGNARLVAPPGSPSAARGRAIRVGSGARPSPAIGGGAPRAVRNPDGHGDVVRLRTMAVPFAR